MDLANEVETHFRESILGIKNELFTSLAARDFNLLIAASGGVDSAVLISLLRSNLASGFKISGLVHVNHSIRDDSMEDELLIKEIASKHKIPFFVKKIKPPSLSGLESWGREKRYEYFHEVLRKTGADFIATAHHLDDLVETFIFRLFTGRNPIHREGIIRKIDHERKVLRPLLDISKKDIYKYAKAVSLQYREDSTNNDINYTRNFIRHKVLPVLEEINPSVRRSLLEYMNYRDEEDEFLSQEVEMIINDNVCLEFESVPRVLRNRLLRKLAEQDVEELSDQISRRRYEALSNMLLSKPSEVKYIDMGFKVRAVINKNFKRLIPVRFETIQD